HEARRCEGAPALCQENGEKGMPRGKWKGRPMQGKSRSILPPIVRSMCTLALVMLLPTVSYAAPPGNHHHEYRPDGNDHQHRDHFSVPEPDVNVLLVIGLGVTSLVAYGVQRRKPRA